MKKVLFATTALIATTGMAAAEVTFGGYGRFGLYFQENATGTNETRIEQRFRLTITGQTTSDNGLEFEGRIRFQTDENGAGASSVAQNSAANFAVSSGGFRLDVGHGSDVIDSGDVFNYYGYGVGLTAFLEQQNGWSLPVSGFGTSGIDDTIAPTVKLRYSVGDFTVAVSYTDDAVATNNTVSATGGNLTQAPGDLLGSEFQIGAGYAFGNYSVGAAFGSRENDTTGVDNDFWVINFGGEVGALAFSVQVGDADSQPDTSYGFSVNYDVGAATSIQFVFSESGNGAADSDAYGIGFKHSLGGGVTLAGGIGDIRGNTTADLGVIFNF